MRTHRLLVTLLLALGHVAPVLAVPDLVHDTPLSASLTVRDTKVTGPEYWNIPGGQPLLRLDDAYATHYCGAAGIASVDGPRGYYPMPSADGEWKSLFQFGFKCNPGERPLLDPPAMNDWVVKLGFTATLLSRSSPTEPVTARLHFGKEWANPWNDAIRFVLFHSEQRFLEAGCVGHVRPAITHLEWKKVSDEALDFELSTTFECRG